jgi:hypothetical protein
VNVTVLSFAVKPDVPLEFTQFPVTERFAPAESDAELPMFTVPILKGVVVALENPTVVVEDVEDVRFNFPIVPLFVGSEETIVPPAQFTMSELPSAPV